MKREDLIMYIKSNVKEIYYNLNSVFKIEKDDFNTLIDNLINSFDFNENLIEKDYSINVFSIDSLKNLNFALTEIGLSDEIIKKIIVKSPIIILYSDKLNYIYYLYKNKNYYGYTILDDGDYSTYLLNDNLKSNIISNNYIIRNMLDYYNIIDYKKECFDNLEKDFKLKNYYFKKKKKY